MKCLCAGILVADHLCSPIHHLPAPGELVLADELPVSIGGCAANVAVNLRRLNAQVEAAGCVGDDTFGEFLLQSLSQRGVGVKLVTRRDDAATSGTLIVNVAGEDRRFIHSFGANAKFTAAMLPAQAIADADVLYVGGYLLMPSLIANELAAAFKSAREQGTKTVLDVVLPSPGDWMPQLAPVLPHTDVFLPNEDEAAAVTGTDDLADQGQRLLQTGVSTVVITRGGEGSFLFSAEERLRAPPFPTEFVGGTGAGDAFTAGYVFGLLSGQDRRGCLRLGAAVGASCVRSVSATDSVFTREECEAFLSQHDHQIVQW